jgi:hypothetical protein
MKNKDIAIKQGIYRYDLGDGLIIFYDRVHGLNINPNKVDMNNWGVLTRVEEVLNEIIKNEK